MPKEKKQTKKQSSGPDTGNLHPKILEAGEVKTLLSWEAPSRPFRKKERPYYTTSAILIIFIILATFFWLGDFLLIGAILSVTFVAYVLAFIPPHNIRYRISTQGITIGEDFYFWHFLDSFWFKEKDGHKILIIQARLRFPGQLMLVLGPSTDSTSPSILKSSGLKGSLQASSGQVDEEKVKKMVARFLPYVEVPYRSWMEKWTEGMQKHFPLENVHR